jgi:hypothetical protein
MNNHIFNEIEIKSRLENIINKNFNNNYDHTWTNYIKIIPKITDYEYSHIYFQNLFIETILKKNLNDDKILNELVNKIIKKIKISSKKLSIYYLPDILKTNNNYEILYCKQESINELNTFSNNENVYIKNITKKFLMIYFSINNDKIIFYVKNYKFFECKINEFDIYIKNNEIVNKYRKLESEKIKIIFKSNYNYFYNDEFIELMFIKGYWIDFIDSTNGSLQIFYSDINIKNNYYFLHYYDIIIFDTSTFSNIKEYLDKWTLETNYYDLNMLRKKMVIILTPNYVFDMYYIKNKNKNIIDFIYYSYNKLQKKEFYQLAFSNNSGLLKNFDNMNKNINTCYLDNLRYSHKNFDFLSREDFFKISNLDINKKLVTIFLCQPVGWDPNNKNRIDVGQQLIFEYNLLKNKKDLKRIVNSFINNGCNVVFKSHPRETLTWLPYNKIIIHDNITNNKARFIIDDLKILNKEYLFIDHYYKNELYKYTDYAVVFSNTSSIWSQYLYNIPTLCISSKKKECDWFNFRKLTPIIIECMYGSNLYFEDIQNNLDETIANFLNTDYKNNYKYFKNHKVWGDLYYTNTKRQVDQIVNLINSNKNLNNTRNNIKLLFDKYYITVYDKGNITLDILYDELIITINSIPNKSYGINIFTFSPYNYNKKYNLTFDCKLHKKENIYLKIYTGSKWIQLNDKLCSSYKKFSVCDVFNFNSKSKWRISSTSKTIGQKIFIKNINFCVL